MLNLILSIVAYLLYFVVMVFYTSLNSFRIISVFDKEKITLKSLINTILIIPCLIPVITIIYIYVFILLQFEVYAPAFENVDIVYFALPSYLKRRWINYLIINSPNTSIYFIENSPSELQNIIIDAAIKNKLSFEFSIFEKIKDDYTKYKYIINRHLNLENYEKEWLQKYKINWRDKQIDIILDL